MWPWKEQAVGELLLSWYTVLHRRHLFWIFISFNGCCCRNEIGLRLSFEHALSKVLGVGFVILIWGKPWNNSAIMSWSSSFLPFAFYSSFVLFWGLGRRKRTRATGKGTSDNGLQLSNWAPRCTIWASILLFSFWCTKKRRFIKEEGLLDRKLFWQWLNFK